MDFQKIFSKRLLALVSLALIAALAYSSNLGEIAGALSKARIELVLAALAASVFSLVFKTLRWLVLLREKNQVDFKKLFCVQASGLALSNLSPGKLLEPVKVLPLKEEGFSYSFLVTTVFWERAFDLVVLFFAASWSLAYLDQRAAPLFAVIALGLLAAVAVMFRHSDRLFKLLSALPFLKFFGKAEGHHFKKRSLSASLVLTVFAWLSDFTAFTLSFQAIGVSLGFARVGSAIAASVLVGIASFLPSGVGSTEAVLSLLLATPAYSAAAILAAVFLARLDTVVFTTLLGFALLPFSKKQ